jgi:hypothetical protein
MTTSPLAVEALSVAQSVMEEGSPQEIKRSYKPCRMVALSALILILGFLCFLIQQMVYVMEYLTAHEQVFSNILSKFSCYQEAKNATKT